MVKRGKRATNIKENVMHIPVNASYTISFASSQNKENFKAIKQVNLPERPSSRSKLALGAALNAF